MTTSSWNAASAPSASAVLTREQLLAQIEALQAQLSEVSKILPTETIGIDFFVHDGSDARPALIPDDVRVVYFHRKDNAMVVTNSDKLRSWADVTKFIWLPKEKFRTFAKSKSRKAI